LDPCGRRMSSLGSVSSELTGLRAVEIPSGPPRKQPNREILRMSASSKEETGRAILRARIRGRCFRHHVAALRRPGRRGATVAGRFVSADLRAPARVPGRDAQDAAAHGLASRRDQAATSRKARLTQAGRTVPPCPAERRGRQSCPAARGRPPRTPPSRRLLLIVRRLRDELARASIINRILIEHHSNHPKQSNQP
jgi:hypothetical protein